MNAFLTRLSEQGATFGSPFHLHFNESPDDYPALRGKTVVVPLINQGFLAIAGEKSAQFLQGQMTCDFEQLDENTTLTGAQCNPQGRMLSSFRAFQQPDGLHLLAMNAGLLDQVRDNLHKYAVFFQAELSNRSEYFLLFGLAGATASASIQTLFGEIPQGNTLLRAPQGLAACQISATQYLIQASTDQAVGLWQQLLESATPVGTDYWNLLNIQAGLGEVSPPLVELFTPQMLNLQATGAISFSKGCYTGQEIVARTKYLGKLKKRMYRLEMPLAALPLPGTVLTQPEQERKIGHVVSAAWKAAGKAELLAVINNSDIKAGMLVVGDGDSACFGLLDLPYGLDS